ncbi:MAG: NAD(P)-binding domain-containing protein [Calditrichaeota bacterium]|nr:NAD(P)-binding domain-containing protein [Calditrichota bacterium]MCB9391349.1 NAD(P)-binding domain-containing protein [Calditrichota bacterium]
MKIGILGTGMVGQVLAGKLAELGHDVMIGTRNVADAQARTGTNNWGQPEFGEWYKAHGHIKLGTFAEAAAHGEWVMNATTGHGSLPALRSAGEQNLNGKILVDIANPLDFSQGMPPSLLVCNTDSLGEQIQREFPKAKVVKALNMVNAYVMVAPNSLGGGDHTLVISGNEEGAKADVTKFLKEQFGWKDILDLGDISTCRATEMYLAMWIRLFGKLQTPMVTIKVVR